MLSVKQLNKFNRLSGLCEVKTENQSFTEGTSECILEGRVKWIRLDEMKWSSLWLYQARNKHHLCPYCFNVVKLHVSMHTEKRGQERHYGIAAQWSLLWGPNALADYGFVSGYCCSLSVKRRMNPSDFSNGISETPAEWALWLVLILSGLSTVSGRIRPHALSKGGTALQCNKERGAECRGCISFSLSFRLCCCAESFRDG